MIINEINIVIIFIDDLGYADVGCFGAEEYATPNIDRIAEEGGDHFCLGVTDVVDVIIAASVTLIKSDPAVFGGTVRLIVRVGAVSIFAYCAFKKTQS